MARFRIHRTFEEELAKKADEFSMQPSQMTWQGVEKGIVKSNTLQTYLKIGILSLTMLAILGILLIQEEKATSTTDATEGNVALVNPAPNKPSSVLPLPPRLQSIPSGNASEGGIESATPIDGGNFKRPQTTSITLRPNKPTSFGNEYRIESEPEVNQPDEQELVRHQKILVKALKPKATPIDLKIRPLIGAFNCFGMPDRPVGRKNRDAWYVQANYSPAYAYRNISARTDYARPLENSKKQLDKGISGFSTRVQARYYFSERFSLAFGLGYTRSGEQIGMAPKKNNPTYDALAEEYEYETSEMNSLGREIYYTNQYSYTELPLTLYSKKPLSPRLSLTTGIGLSLGYMVSTNARCYDYRIDHYVSNKKFLRDWTIGSHAQLLLEYSINTRWGVAAGPEVNYSLLSTYRNYYTLSQHQFSVGMNFGVQWKLFDVTKSRLLE